MLNSYWTQLRYHPTQSALWSHRGPFAAVVAGRGSGKTELARRKTIMSLAIKKPWSDPLYFYALPTYAQAKRVAWKPLLNLIPHEWIKGFDPKKHNEKTDKEKLDGVNISDSCIRTVFGSELYVVGMDKPQRIEGLQFDGGVLDESSDQKPGAFTLSILPTLSHRNPWCWRIGVPKRSGAGRIEFRQFFEKGVKEQDNIKSFFWTSEEILLPEQIQNAKAILSQQDYSEQYQAMWLDAGGTIYHSFAEENVSTAAHYRPELPIFVGMDFNVSPMGWVLGHKIDGKLHVFEEIFLRDTNTRSCLTYLAERFESHMSGWRFFGDASANSRKTSATETDYIIIKNDTRFIDKKVYFLRKNPKLKNRFSTVNGVLCNAKGERNMLVNPKCVHLLDDLRLMSFKEGTTEPEDYTGTVIGHVSDGLGYLCCRVFPMKVETDIAPNVVTN